MDQSQIEAYLQLQSDIASAKQEVEEQKLTLQVAEEELKKLEAVIRKTEIQVNLESYSAQRIVIKDEMTLLEETIPELETTLSGLTDEYNDLKTEITAIKNTVSEKTTLRRTKQTLVNKLIIQEQTPEIEQQIIDLNAEIAVLDAELAVLVPQQITLLADLAALEPPLSDLQNELRSSQLRYAGLGKSLLLLDGQFSDSQVVLDGLNSEKANKDTSIIGVRGNLNTAIASLHHFLDLFRPISDPRILVEALNDNTPFLLLPVRLETRFMTIKHVRRVNEYTELPVEVKGTVPLIRSKYGFGSIDLVERELYDSSVIPRLTKNDSRSIPDGHELWIRIFPDDIAIHTHEKRLTQDEFEAGKNYWNAIWDMDPESANPEDSKLGPWRAVVAGYGPERAAWILQKTEPTNLEVEPHPPAAVFPTLTLKLTAWTDQPRSKVMPDRFVARVYPTGSTYREVIGKLIPDPLPIGFNPSSGTLDDEFDQVDTKVQFPEEIQWLTDFETAEDVGMGIRIPLVGNERETGFSKILVLGLKLAVNKADSKALLEELIDNHHYTSGGLSLLTQGTPTNNTEDAVSGYAGHEIGNEESFAAEMKAPLFEPTEERFQKTDGQWFSEMLGISPKTVQHLRNADKFDQQEEMAMSRALWPATMGYYIKQMLTPLVLSQAHNDVRNFYCDHVIARGRIPSFRVDNQPYGVLVTSAFSKWKFDAAEKSIPVTLKNMYEKVLLPMNADFDSNIQHIIHAGSGGDKQENFLKILGLHASSVEYHQRFGGGQYFSWNLLQYFQHAPVPGSGPAILEMNNSIPEALRTLYMTSTGFNIPINPRILQMLFVADQRLLNGPVIDLDVLPYSETRGIQSFPQTTTNYIEWMLMSDFGRIRAENFNNITGVVPNQKPPKALLYLLLRHGYLLEYINTATGILIRSEVIGEEAQVELELHKAVGDFELSVEEDQLLTNLVTAEVTLDFEITLAKQVQQQEAKGKINQSTKEATIQKIRAKEAFNVQAVIDKELHIRKDNYAVEQSKWDYLVKTFPVITGEQSMLDYIMSQLNTGEHSVENLEKIQEALEILRDMPTARLERCLAESLDTCNYRLDAWLLALVNQRAENQMQDQLEEETPGAYLGSFGMLEDLKPNTSFPGIHVVDIVQPGTLPNSPYFVYMGNDPLTLLEYSAERNKIVAPPRVNSQNLGFIHGPSMNHATAAAILRAGYGGHQGTASPDDALAVNLRSDRVRKALFYIEGIRNGQDLAALLGYKFERGLHDLDAGLDQYILDIRRKYPLVANGIVEDDASESSIEAFEARNVVDGLKLIEAYRDYPATWSEDTGIPHPSAAYTLITGQITEIADHLDALGDLMLSESMYQVATGNHERAGAVMKALGEGNLIPDPQIIETPRLDKVFMQRKAILFDTSADPQAWTGAESPRSYCEPGLNSWLKTVLPDPGNIVINYQYTTFDVDNTEILTDAQMTISDLYVQPIELIALLTDQNGSEDGTLFSAVLNYLIIHGVSHTEVPASIRFIDRTGLTSDQVTIFELLPLIRSLQDIIGQGRVAKPDDFLIESEVYDVKQAAFPSEGMDLTQVESRLTEAFGPAVTPGRRGLTDMKDSLTAAMDAANGIVDIIGSESLLDDLRIELLRAGSFATQGTVPESAYEYSIDARNKLTAQAARILAQMANIEAALIPLFAQLSGLSDIEDHLEKLQEIGKVLFGRNFKVFPEFKFYNQADIDLSRSNTALLAEGGEFTIDEWLQGISKVRPKMATYHLSSMISESLSNNSPLREVIQLPIASNLNDRWLGAKLPDGYSIPDQAISLVMDLPEDYYTENLQSGIILDEWTESIPEPNAITGLSFNYDQPNSEAPNTLLLAVTPEMTGNWSWSDLMDILDETLLMAKKRAIDPDIINKHSYLGHALPAIVASVEAADTAPGLDFSRNIVPVSSGQVGPIDLQQYLASE